MLICITSLIIFRKLTYVDEYIGSERIFVNITLHGIEIQASTALNLSDEITSKIKKNYLQGKKRPPRRGTWVGWQMN